MMSSLPYRNRNGRVVAMPSCAVTDAKKNFSELLRTINRKRAIAITHRDEPEAVLLSVTEYQSLLAAGQHTLEEIIAEFDDIITQLQASEAKRSAKNGIEVTSSTLGRAAVRSSRKHS